MRYALAMVAAAIVSAVGIVGFGWCDLRGGCFVVTGDQVTQTVLDAITQGANAGYAAGRAATCGKDDI